MLQRGRGSNASSSACSVQALLPLACVWKMGEGAYFRGICRAEPLLPHPPLWCPWAAFLLENSENQSSLELASCIHPGGSGDFWEQERFLHCWFSARLRLLPTTKLPAAPCFGGEGRCQHGRRAVLCGHEASSPASSSA